MKIANELYQSAHLLLHLGEDGSPIYADQFRQLNSTVSRLVSELYPVQCSSAEEEAEVCLSLLMGFSAITYNVEKQEEKLQMILDRTTATLPKLDNSLLKCQLLLYCYEMVQDKELMEEAKGIIISWGGRELTEEEEEMMWMYNGMIR